MKGVRSLFFLENEVPSQVSNSIMDNSFYTAHFYQ